MQLPTGSTADTKDNAISPALYLFPLNESAAWTPKCIVDQHTRIGRQTNKETVPTEKNGFFDSKVMSRRHAEVWQENGKIYLKDTESWNGTYVNGKRLSGESLASEPFELRNDDIVEFGIDVIGEDKKTVVHHKVAARVAISAGAEQDSVLARL